MGYTVVILFQYVRNSLTHAESQIDNNDNVIIKQVYRQYNTCRQEEGDSPHY